MLGEQLEKLIKIRGYTQQSLADALNIPRNTVWRWVNAKATPNSEMIQRVADFFRISIEELLNGPIKNALKITIDWEVKDMSSIAIGGNEVGFGYRASDDNLLYWGAIPATSSVDEVLEKIRAELAAAMAGRNAHVMSKKNS